MKRIILLFFFLACFVQLTTAQTEQSIKLGLSFNPTFNWLYVGGNDVEDTKTQMGFDYGLNADFLIDHNDRYAITTGILISNINNKVDYNPNHEFNLGGKTFAANTPLGVDYSLKYVEIPLAFHLRSKQFNRNTFWGKFGVFTAWNFNAEASTSDGTLTNNDINKDIRLFNMGLNVGLGCEYDLGERNALSFGLVYKNGFFDIMKANLGDKTTTKSLALQVGFIF